jgi:hypothetical protein
MAAEDGQGKDHPATMAAADDDDDDQDQDQEGNDNRTDSTSFSRHLQGMYPHTLLLPNTNHFAS